MKRSNPTVEATHLDPVRVTARPAMTAVNPESRRLFVSVRNASTGRRPEWVAVVREGADVRRVYLASDLITALARAEYLYPGVEPEVRS